MKQFEIGKKYKFNMDMMREFLEDHDTNARILEEISIGDYGITVKYVEDAMVSYGSRLFLCKTDIRFFTALEDIVPPSESEIVKGWFEKVKYVTREDSPYYVDYSLVISDMGAGMWRQEEAIDMIINVYDEHKRQEKEHNKQSLLDKKKALELELAQINEQLGE